MRCLSLRSGGAGGAAARRPLAVETHEVLRAGARPRSGSEVTFPQGMLWGVLGCVMSFTIGIVVERRQGTPLRLAVAPIDRRQILAGKALGRLAAILAVQALLAVSGRVLFGVRPASVVLLAAAQISVAAGFVGIRMRVAALGRCEQAVSGAGWAILMPLAMIGEGMVPRFVMPGWMQTLSHASPVKWAILALEGALWRGFGPAEIVPPSAILLALGSLCFALGARALRTS